MKNLRFLLASVCCIALSFGAIAQGRINTMNHTPNPANSGNFVTALLNVSLWNSCDYFNTANVYQSGYTFNVYLDFNTSPGFCAQIVTPTVITVPLGTLSAGSYTVNYCDWDYTPTSARITSR